MAEKITTTKHIRQQLEELYQQKTLSNSIKIKTHKYKGLGLNWRTKTIVMLILFYVGLYNVQAQSQSNLNLDEVNTSVMLSYDSKENNYSALRLLASDYTINVTGIVADVTIIQTFINDSSHWIKEGMYAFPVAKNAAVYQMKLIIGKRIIEGEIHEKKQAQEIYQQAKSQGLSASLVKQYRPNLFTTDVANIMPNEKIQVEISYQQTLHYDAGHIDFRLPLAIKSRYMDQKYLANDAPKRTQDTFAPSSTVNDSKSRSISLSLEAGFELSDLSSLNHSVTIKQSDVFHHITLNDNQLYDDHDFVLRWFPALGNEPTAALFSEVIGNEEYVLMMLLPPQNTKVSNQNREVVFIIDTSGSMFGSALNAAKDALLFGLTQLKGSDKFNVVEFNSYTRNLFEHSQLSNPGNIDLAIDFIAGLKSDGGTNMAPALAFALQDEVDSHYLKQIIFITDGSVGNEAQLFTQINQDIANARLFTVAIGAAPNNYFMNKAALIGRGTYTNIARLNDVDTSMSELFEKIASPALTNVAIDWGTDVEQSPEVIPDLYARQALVVTAKMRSFNPDVLLYATRNTKNWSTPFALKHDGNSKGIARLWARNQLEDLTDDYMLGDALDLDLLQNQITQIALKYHLVSEFTSLVAVDKTPDLSRQVQIQAHNLEEEIISQANFPQTALGWKLKLLIGVFFLAFGIFVSRQKAC